MRANAINILLIGIAINDLLFLLLFVYDDIAAFQYQGISEECIPPLSYLQFLITLSLGYSQDITFNASTWLGIIIALIRTLAIRYPMSPGVQRLIRPQRSYQLVLSVFLISFLISSLNWIKWSFQRIENYRISSEACTMYPVNTSIPFYYISENRFFQKNKLPIDQIGSIANGVFQLTPPILYPFLAGILYFELKTIQKRRGKLKIDNTDKSSDNTTKVVIWMTFFYFIAIAPLGLAQLLSIEFFYDKDIIDSVNSAAEFLSAITILHTSTNCFICLSLNSQYRNTIKSMIKISDKKVVHPTKVTVFSTCPTPNCYH